MTSPSLSSILFLPIYPSPFFPVVYERTQRNWWKVTPCQRSKHPVVFFSCFDDFSHLLVQLTLSRISIHSRERKANHWHSLNAKSVISFDPRMIPPIRHRWLASFLPALVSTFRTTIPTLAALQIQSEKRLVQTPSTSERTILSAYYVQPSYQTMKKACDPSKADSRRFISVKSGTSQSKSVSSRRELGNRRENVRVQ